MLLTADELIAPGGPSAPVWAFFTAISLAIVAIIAQQLKARSDFKQLKILSERTKDAAQEANESATQAQTNTYSIANGFADRMDRKLDAIRASQISTDQALRDHLEWHLEDRKAEQHG